MDLFGVLVVSVVTGLGGGILRDLLLGHTPPGTLSDWRYLAAAGIAGILVFAWYSRVVHHGRFITGFDAVGLSIFTVTGTTIALSSGLGQVPAVLLGMLTGVEIVAAGATFGLRMVSVRRGWRIPVATPKQ
jgi:uncharacterized membrane protein YeiH